LPFQYPNRRDRSPGREEQRVRDFSKGEERESDYERKKTNKERRREKINNQKEKSKLY
jgi:hypothetical protein